MRITRRSGAILALAGLVLAAGGYGAYRYFVTPSGEVEGSREGFVATEAPPPAARESWPEYGFDPQRRRANATLRLTPPFRERWRFAAKSLIEFPPVIAGDRAYLALNDGRALGLDLQSGRVIWEVKLDGQTASSPAITEDRVLITTTRGRIVSLDPETGTRQWVRRIGTQSESSPLVIGDSVYVGTLDGGVMRLRVADGTPVWTTQAAGQVKAGLAASGDTVIVGDYAGRVTAFRQSDGQVVWQITSPGPRFRGAGRFYAGPAVAYGRVYIGNINGYALALDARTGRTAWVSVIDNFIYSSAAVANETVFFGSYDKRLYALDAATSKERWRFDAGERISGSPSVIGNLVFVSTLATGGRKGVTTALDITSGKPVWSFPDGRYSPAVAVRGTLLIAGRQTLYGFSTE
jgi:outer membrane protein assembly factor BamB